MRRQRRRGRLWPYVDVGMCVIRERTSEGEQCLLCLRELFLQLRLPEGTAFNVTEKTVKKAEELLKGDKDIPKHQYWPHILITKANIDSPEVRKYGLWGDEVTRGR